MAENKIVSRIWFEINNMKSVFWGYDGMEELKNEYSIDHKNDESYVRVKDVLSIIERYLGNV